MMRAPAVLYAEERSSMVCAKKEIVSCTTDGGHFVDSHLQSNLCHLLHQTGSQHLLATHWIDIAVRCSPDSDTCQYSPETVTLFQILNWRALNRPKNHIFGGPTAGETEILTFMHRPNKQSTQYVPTQLLTIEKARVQNERYGGVFGLGCLASDGTILGRHIIGAGVQ
jgi:hypothetical protein